MCCHNSIRDLGVTFDQKLMFNEYIALIWLTLFQLNMNLTKSVQRKFFNFFKFFEYEVYVLQGICKKKSNFGGKIRR